MNESCRRIGGTLYIAMSYIQMSHVTHINVSFHVNERVISYIQMSHGTRMHESWHTREGVMLHILR